MLNVGLAGDHQYGLAVTGDVFDGIFLCCLISHEIFWMRSRSELSQFLRIFLPTIL